MSKQDRQGVRTPADIERKYSFSEYKKSYSEAQKAQADIAIVEQHLRTDIELFEQQMRTELQNYAQKTDLDLYVKNSLYQNDMAQIVDQLADANYFFSEVDKKCDDLAEDVQMLLDQSTTTEWIPLTVDSAFKVRNDDESVRPVYKVTGNVVTVCGIVANIAEMTSTSSGAVFARGIPEEYRPHMDHHIICQGSGMNRWVCSVKTDGTLVMSRYGITEQGTVPANSWLPFSCTYQY